MRRSLALNGFLDSRIDFKVFTLLITDYDSPVGVPPALGVGYEALANNYRARFSPDDFVV